MSTATVAPAPEDLEAYRATERTTRGDVQLARHGAGRIEFAAGDPDLIVGMAVCKPGVFNGVFEVTRDDLDAWVARFEELRGTFRPPMRLDHGWSVTEVIGRFEALRVENRADESAGGTVVPMLVGDVRLVGTPDERKLIREWIKGDKLNERSSEFWPYRTNNGAEYPSVFAGCAFVDIPAVEGLGSITLRRDGATLSAAAPDAPEESGNMADEQTTETDGTVDEVETPTEPTPVVDETPAAADALVIAQPEPEPTEDDEDDDAPVGEVPADLAAALRAEGVQLDARQVAALAARVERLAAERVEASERIARFRSAGVMVPAIASTAETLLRHADQTVRDGVAAILDIARPPVALRDAPGVTESPAPREEDGTPSPAELRELDRDGFASAWAALSTENRKNPEYLAAYREVIG